MDKNRVPLYERLPEIYRIKDEEQKPPGQLKHYLGLVEMAFDAIHHNIESLYHDLFIETCDDWVIPYMGDLLGTSHLKGEAWTLRADVADTIALRRRKGTIAGIQRLTHNLTRWGVHCAELRDNLLWNQHLNHQRPDAGGLPPYSLPTVTRFTPVRGGTLTLRDPAMLSLLNGPFDPFGHVADVKRPFFGNIHYNLPNLAIFLWRLQDYRVAVSSPVFRGTGAMGTAEPDEATHVVRFDLHPLGRPLRLFNSNQLNIGQEPPVASDIDETPGPIHPARLNENSEAGNPQKYVAVDIYDPTDPHLADLDIADVGLQLHLPEPAFAGQTWPEPTPSVWSVRGANLCAWEDGVLPSLKNREIVIDPVIGRLLIGVGTVAGGNGAAEAAALENDLLVTTTHGAVGPVGAQPISRPDLPEEWNGTAVTSLEVNFHNNPDGLRDALSNLHAAAAPVVIEIRDDMVHDLDLGDIAIVGTIDEDGGPNLRLNRSLIVRAADGRRPIIRLKRPLRFRPTNPANGEGLTVHLEGLYLTRHPDFPVGEPLIARAALDRLEMDGCTLDPGGFRQLDGFRAPIHPALSLREPYGFANAADETAFDQTPKIILRRTIAGPLLLDRGYTLDLTETIVDAGKGVLDEPGADFAVSSATDTANDWGPPTQVNGVTIYGRMRVERINGRGGIWVHTLEVLNNQVGCIRYSYFSGQGDRLPQNLGCVNGNEAQLRFVDECFGDPAYGQLAHTTDFSIRERGPKDDAMGAFGFLLEAHKWRNLQIRFREFMPVGVRPLLIPVT